MTQSGTVLLILPPGEQARVLGEYLRLAGLEVHGAESGLHALTQLERAVPDAIVCHALLEDMTGNELLEIVRSDAQFGHLAFVLLEGRRDANFTARDSVLPAGASAGSVLDVLLQVLPAGSEALPELSSNLETLGLESVLGALGRARRSGRLTVSSLSSEALVWLDSGQVVNARHGRLHGEAAFMSIVSGTRVLLNADYHFAADQAGDVPRLIEAPTHALLQQVG